MNFEDKKREAGDAELETALRHFRQSVHGWSEREFDRVQAGSARRFSRVGWMARMRGPMAGWAMACVLAVAAVTVPVGLRHERAAEVARATAVQQQKQAFEAAKVQVANLVSDEELLSSVDSDIAQATPEALEPLASLMENPSSK